MIQVRKWLASHPAIALPLIRAAAWARGFRVDVRQDRLEVRKDNREIRLSKWHWYYLGDVIQNFYGLHSAVVGSEDLGISVVDYSTPRMQHVASVGVELFYTSLVEESDDIDSYLALLSLAPGDTVIDAGAYCGATTYAFAQAVGSRGKVIAIEADPHSFAALTWNVAAHRLTNVDPIHAALWGSNGVVAFASERALGSAVAAAGPRIDNLVDVEAVTLERLSAREMIGKVDAIKIDIEGAEYAVLDGSSSFFDEFRPRTVIEIHRTPQVRDGFERCEAYFRRRGYRTSRQPRNLLLCEPQ